MKSPHEKLMDTQAFVSNILFLQPASHAVTNREWIEQASN